MTIKTHERFGSVRTVEQDGSTWYVGRDVSKALGYKNAEGFVAKHVKDADKKCVPVRSLSINSAPRTIIINRNGLNDLCKAASSVDADNILNWLLEDVKIEEKADLPQIITVAGVSGFVDNKGVAWLNAEDIARECGWTQTQIKDGKEYTSIRWETINGYLDELGFFSKKNGENSSLAFFPKKVGESLSLSFQKTVGKNDFIPENIFYRLIWKSRSDYAEAFQALIADVILPAIRRKGSYVKGEMSLFPDEEPVKEKKAIRRPVPELAFVYVVEFANGWCKVGVAKDLTARMKDLQKETKQEIVRWAASPLMTRDEALLLERALKVKFFDRIIVGEFFSVPFEEIKAALQTSPAERLIALADKLQDSDVKQTLLAKAAALLIG